MKYIDRLTVAMNMLADRRAIFLGQAIAYPGTGMTQTFRGVSPAQLIELPVMEDLQMGMSTGMAIADPSRPVVTVYPRINFLMCAMNQLLLHLDALPRYSDYRPQVIIRTAIATPEPLNPGPQHLGDYSHSLDQMFRTIEIERIHGDGYFDPVLVYRRALGRKGPTLVIEYSSLYDNEVTL